MGSNKKLNVKSQKSSGNESGFITAEFIFSIVLAAGVCSVLFALTFTFSVIEITQYISYSAARAMIAANMSPEDQAKAAEDKYTHLINKPALKGLFFGDANTFELSEKIDVRIAGESKRDFSEAYRDSGSMAGRVFFTGTRIEINPKILNMRIAFLGSTSETGESRDFLTKVTTILTRESSWQECNDLYVLRRYEAIGRMNDRFKQYGRAGASSYVPLEDNGC